MRVRIATAVAALAAVVAAQGMTPEHVLRLQTVRDAWPAGDGSVLYTRSVPRSLDEGPGSARTHLFWRDARGNTVPLIAGDESARGVAVHPDGKRFSFLAKLEGDPRVQVWLRAIQADSAPARASRLPVDVRAYQWRPDGLGFAFTALEPRSPAQRKAREAGFRQVVVDEENREIPLWLAHADGRVQRLTAPGAGSVFDFAWHPRGTHVLVAMAPRNSVDHGLMFKRLYVIDVATGELRQLADNPGKLGALAWSPDGNQIAWLGAVDRRDPHAGNVFVIDARAQPAQPRLVTPDLLGMVHTLEWVTDARGPQLLAVMSRGVRTELVRIDPESRAVQTLFARTGFAFRKARSFGPRRTLFVGSTAQHPDELFVGHADGRLERWTDSNPWLAQVELAEQEVLRYEARDGVEIEGVLMYPVGYREGRRYPLVLVVHGGPESHYSEGWNTSYGRWGQMLCARGMFAFYLNYRASTGYGVAFAKADHGDIMGAEARDLIDGVDALVARGLVDRDRVAIGGGSYGGLQAAWGATRHTDRYAAAVSFVPVTDMQTKLFVTDIPNEGYLVHQSEVWPHDQWGFLRDRSPTTYAPKCRTPLLLLGGTEDTRVHPSQPFMLYRAVKFATDTPVRYVQYPGEGHGNRSNVYQYDYALRTLRWFEHYLAAGDRRGVAPPVFDVAY